MHSLMFCSGTVLRRSFGLCVLILTAAAPGADARAQSGFPADSTIQRLLDERIRDGRAAGIVLGLIEPDAAARVFTAGTAGPGRPLDTGTVFEIGSITKVFTGILLADMVRTGDVALDDPVSRYLPAGVGLPSRNGREITLGHLTSQTSALPRLPGNMRPATILNPYADYTVEQLYDFLGAYQLQRDPGERFEYSNLGVGLLGHVLALRAGLSYEELLTRRVLRPLGLQHTAITLTPAMRERIAAGHNAAGDTVPPWDLPTLAGAGALRSTMSDMLAFAAAALRPQGEIGQSIALSMQPRHPAGNPNSMIGMGWIRLASAADTIVFHNGGTGGFRSFLGLVPSAGRAVVLLTNSGGAGSDDLALHLLNPALPLAPPRRE